MSDRHGDAPPTGPRSLHWKVHLNATPEIVFARLSTDRGRESFWAESSHEVDGEITLVFPDRSTTVMRIRSQQPPHVFEVDYFNVTTRFVLQRIDDTSTVLEVGTAEIPANETVAVAAGWVSVLLNLKSVVNFGHDLRNHERARTWADGFVDN